MHGRAGIAGLNEALPESVIVERRLNVSGRSSELAPKWRPCDETFRPQPDRRKDQNREAWRAHDPCDDRRITHAADEAPISPNAARNDVALADRKGMKRLSACRHSRLTVSAAS